MSDTVYYIILVLTGIVSGFINTIAGGGTLITLPALMLTGMQADIANATNRVSIFLAAIVSVKGFEKHGHIQKEGLFKIILPALLGALFGAITASYTPKHILKFILIGTMLAVTIWMLVKKSDLDIPENTNPITFSEKPIAWFYLFLTGFYGGYIQAGVGFLLIIVLTGIMKYDILRTNGLKVTITLFYTTVALGVFILRDQVDWVPGLILAVGSMIGAFISIKFAISVNKKVLNWVIFILVLIASIATILKK